MRVGIILIFTSEETKAQGISVICLRARGGAKVIPEAVPSTTLSDGSEDWLENLCVCVKHLYTTRSISSVQ